MNNIREIERLNQSELDAAVPTSASWHNDWDDTAYIYIGGLPYELSEGDIITIFSQFGEPVHVSLVRDKDTGKSKGFAFLKYENQRSTTLAVDNLGGANVLGRTIRVDHTRYKPKEGDAVEGTGINDGAKDDEDERGGKRRKKTESVERSPTPEILPEEIELQKLIRDHDEDDPMKDWLVREKQKEVEEARRKREMAVTKHRSRDDREKNKSKHRPHRHRSNSRDRKSRSRSRDRRERSRRSGKDGEKQGGGKGDGDREQGREGHVRGGKEGNRRGSERHGKPRDKDRERNPDRDRDQVSEREHHRRDGGGERGERQRG